MKTKLMSTAPGQFEGIENIKKVFKNGLKDGQAPRRAKDYAW